jgi:hypothetical protein
MYKITHISRTGPEQNKYSVIGFITEKEGVYRFGIDNLRQFSGHEIQDQVEAGKLIELSNLVDFDPKQDYALWLGGTNDDAVVLRARKEDPLNDPQRIVVWKGSMFTHP